MAAPTPAVPGAINVTPPLTGLEIVAITTGGPTVAQTTTQAIADLAAAGAGGETTNTAITTVGNGTLTAAAIAGGLITRSGPVAAFSDATATAAAIVAAVPGAFVGQSFFLRVKNTTNFVETLTAGAGVTLTGTATIPANSTGTYLVTLTSLTAVTILFIQTSFNVSNSGTFVANGVTPVTVANAALTANSVVLFGLNTIGGTVGAVPAVKTVTPGTGFTVAGTASDTSTYNYLILG